MQYKWGKSSKRVYDTLDPRLQIILDELLQWVDVSLTSGYRDREEQNTLFENRKTQARYPLSKHNRNPSHAVDLQPHPLPSDEKKLWAGLGYIAGLARLIAHRHGWKLRWGGDWNRDGSVVDNKFNDLYHLEIVDDEVVADPVSTPAGGAGGLSREEGD